MSIRTFFYRLGQRLRPWRATIHKLERQLKAVENAARTGCYPRLSEQRRKGDPSDFDHRDSAAYAAVLQLTLRADYWNEQFKQADEELSSLKASPWEYYRG